MTGRAAARLRPAVAVGAGLAVVSVLGCGSGPSDDEARERLAEDLIVETGGALDDATASCVADALHADFGEDSFRQIRDARAAATGGRGTDDGRADEVRDRVIDVFARCDALGPIIDPGG